MTETATDRLVAATPDGYHVRGTRVSLDSIAWAFLNGQTTESIVLSFPTLTLEQVEGALSYYLAHRATIDAYLAKGETERAALRQTVRDQDPLWYRKLDDARRKVA